MFEGIKEVVCRDNKIAPHFLVDDLKYLVSGRASLDGQHTEILTLTVLVTAIDALRYFETG